MAATYDEASLISGGWSLLSLSIRVQSRNWGFGQWRRDWFLLLYVLLYARKGKNKGVCCGTFCKAIWFLMAHGSSSTASALPDQCSISCPEIHFSGWGSWTDLWGPAQTRADAQALQATGWAPEYYSFIDLPMVLCQWLTGIWAAQQHGIFSQLNKKEGKEENLSQVLSGIFWF